MNVYQSHQKESDEIIWQNFKSRYCKNVLTSNYEFSLKIENLTKEKAVAKNKNDRTKNIIIKMKNSMGHSRENIK